MKPAERSKARIKPANDPVAEKEVFCGIIGEDVRFFGARAITPQ